VLVVCHESVLVLFLRIQALYRKKHFIMSLVWRGPWLGIEPGTSCTRSQYCITRLSRRRWWWY